MPAASILRRDRRRPESLRIRLTALALAVAIAVAIVVALIALGVLPPVIPRDVHPLRTFDVVPVVPSPVHTVSRVVKPAGSAAPRKVTPVPQPKPQSAAPTPPSFIQMDSTAFASADIGKIAPAPGTSDSDGAGSGKDSKAAYGPGEGPGGAPLYYAEWYREPSNAELSTYLPAGGPVTGFALIACKTVEAYHVENCRVLGETPGSGLGGAMRRAAWQFLVRPPRLGGKPLVGAWVRIRIDFTPSGAAAG
jgi:hypothetical protein